MRNRRLSSILIFTVLLVVSTSTARAEARADAPIRAPSTSQAFNAVTGVTGPNLLAEITGYRAKFSDNRHPLRLPNLVHRGNPPATALDRHTPRSRALDRRRATMPATLAMAKPARRIQPAAVEPQSQEPPEPPLTADQLLLRLLALGAGIAAGLLALLAIYHALRPRLREYSGRLRMRRVHRRLARRRRQERR